MNRKTVASRKTKETDIQVDLTIDGSGTATARTGMGFFDHMLESLGKHAHFDLKIRANGDLHIDDHHTVEDVGLVLGDALHKSLGNKEGIERFGYAFVPMDESLARVVIDLSGRPYLVYNVKSRLKKIKDFDLYLLEDFFRAFCQTGFFNLHIEVLYGQNPHHIYEAIFKAMARALKMACQKSRVKAIPSTKGVL